LGEEIVIFAIKVIRGLATKDDDATLGADLADQAGKRGELSSEDKVCLIKEQDVPQGRIAGRIERRVWHSTPEHG